MSEHFEDDHLLAAARVGVEAERFLSSPIGKKLWERAEEKIRVAIDALVVADPEDPRLIRELQNDAKLGAMFKTWMSDIIHEGLQAEIDIQREEAGD